ncbi:hypothetical protein [Rhodococcoides fascians]|uniref:hypothetical protein n=1 Tax=Rhodococcoides fascians TaxID=1828 RepID=UPI001427B5BB
MSGIVSKEDFIALLSSARPRYAPSYQDMAETKSKLIVDAKKSAQDNFGDLRLCYRFTNPTWTMTEKFTLNQILSGLIETIDFDHFGKTLIFEFLEKHHEIPAESFAAIDWHFTISGIKKRPVSGTPIFLLDWAHPFGILYFARGTDTEGFKDWVRKNKPRDVVKATESAR